MSVPVVTVAQMRGWEDASWSAGRDINEVMRLAGAAVAQQAMVMTNKEDVILLLAGRGNNGGDTRLAAEQIKGRKVTLVEVSSQNCLSEIQKLLDGGPALVVDGLFGIGLNRELVGDWAELVEAVNASGSTVLAVDTPSGLNADTGEPMGVAVRADVTITFGSPKLGLIENHAADFVGRLEVAADVGLIQCSEQTGLNWLLPGDFEGFPPARHVNSHKETFGHLGIIAGSMGFHGAAVLAARAAQRAQPGLITLITPKNIYRPVASQLRSQMVHPWTVDSIGRLAKCTALLAGPGLADEELPKGLRNEIIRLWYEDERPMVLDASALDWLKPMKKTGDRTRVITPHPGEAGRLLGVSSDALQAGRCAALRKLASQYDCHVVLKGAHTLIGESVGDIYINSSGNPYLAQGGSGDVLSGFIGGWLAQPWTHAAPMLALTYSVWRHGRSADWMSSHAKGWGMDELVTAL
tara:strand:+ start:148 stop:1545 length:1398 start_codon:yes stop_codon:yes gene_type:complete